MKILGLAAVLLLAAASAQAEPAARMRTQNNLKQMGLAATGSTTSPQGVADLAHPIRKTKAEIELVCPDTTYILSTGTKKGSCKDGLASCGDGDNSAKASCYSCESSSGAGSCKTK
ncbi:hypothetical protein JKL49_07755 [Phenylobacterium sp. 20VBR1]|uniref:Uncharacterized protein n=1 Tax=Phenylobacterium glaciei TaxID=2803784 RepID=A0A941D2Y4_9CAUL|nr:hypothetical protein [Phenylobacterium glaciei]MBR7619283.1 hypothetical protein [Phenylobacterium glaciei]QQZ51636.1 hypothetical protein JKL49_12060 [Phenylobacterium glaciei]